MSCQMIRADDWDRMVKAQAVEGVSALRRELEALGIFEPLSPLGAPGNGFGLELSGASDGELEQLLAEVERVHDQQAGVLAQLRSELTVRDRRASARSGGGRG